MHSHSSIAFDSVGVAHAKYEDGFSGHVLHCTLRCKPT